MEYLKIGKKLRLKKAIKPVDYQIITLKRSHFN